MTNSIKVLAVVVAVLAVLDLGLAAGQLAADELPRNIRAFPYNTIFQGFRRPFESEYPLIYPNLPSTPAEREIADLVDSIDSSYGRFRRNAAPIYKRYACRFKFCRIFDA